MPNPGVWLAKTVISLYQMVLSPWLGNQCRFTPTCSCYAQEAFEKHRFFKGLVLTLWRILRCNPLYRGAWQDPVPEQFALRQMFHYKRPQK